MASNNASPTKQLVSSGTSPSKQVSTQLNSKSGSEFYRLAESSSNKALNAFGLSSVGGGGGGRESRKHRRGSRIVEKVYCLSAIRIICPPCLGR